MDDEVARLTALAIIILALVALLAAAVANTAVSLGVLM